MRRATSFSANEREVINERRHGWEQASCDLLAKVFGTSPQVIAAITKFSASPSVGRTAAVTAHSQRGGQSICEHRNLHEDAISHG